MSMKTAKLTNIVSSTPGTSNSNLVVCVTEDGEEITLNANDIDFNQNFYVFFHENHQYKLLLNSENENTSDKFVWNNCNTKLYIECLLEYIGPNKIYESKKNMYKNISKKMTEKGYVTTILQLQNKYKSLERSFKNWLSKNLKALNNRTGRGRIGVPFEEELEELFGHRHSIKPRFISCGQHTQNEVYKVEEESDEEKEIDSLQGDRPASPLPSEQGADTPSSPEQDTARPIRKRLGETGPILENCEGNIAKVQKLNEQRDKMLEIQNELVSEFKRFNDNFEKLVNNTIKFQDAVIHSIKDD